MRSRLRPPLRPVRRPARTRKRAILFFAALFALAACGSDGDTAASSTSEAAPTTAAEAGSDNGSESESAFLSISAPTVDGGQLDFGSLEGQDTVLWFWAPW